MAAPKNRLKAALADGQLQCGLWLNLASPLIAEMAATAGFDWCLIDGEHGPNDIPTLLSQVQAMAGQGADVVVRVPAADPVALKRVLDLGVQTVLVPMVDTAEQAHEVAAACRYPPDGVRGLGGPGMRASGWGGVADYATTANDEICVMVQAESRAALANLAGILAVPGIDGVFVGPGDLAADMGLLTEPGSAVLQDAITGALQTIRAAGKIAGIIDESPQGQARWVAAGANFLGLGGDASALRSALHGLAKAGKGHASP